MVLSCIYVINTVFTYITKFVKGMPLSTSGPVLYSLPPYFVPPGLRLICVVGRKEINMLPCILASYWVGQQWALAVYWREGGVKLGYSCPKSLLTGLLWLIS